VARDLKLGLNTGYWSAGPPPGVEDAVAEADRLEFDSIWTAEAYGSDVLTPLAWWGSQTRNVRLGTAIMQMSARQPAAAAMAAMTMDHLSGGRFILGLGVSGPQVVEGWYGRPFEKPLARTREYIGVVREIVARKAPVTNDGPHYPLPLPNGTGLAKPLKATIHPVRDDIPIFLGAEGPKNVALSAEICDGWLALFFSPRNQDFYKGEAKRIQDLYLDGKKDEAAAAVPTALVEDLALIGPEDKVRADLEAWRDSIVTTLLIGGDAATVRRVAELVRG
jgi:F420-dependent oxidoreductase-like protein